MRPTAKVPRDRRHQFFTRWLPADDEGVAAWEAWFCRTDTPYLRVERRGRVMLYTHRVRQQGRYKTVWCCESGETS